MFNRGVILMKSVQKALAVLLSVLLLGCACSFAEGGEWICPDCGAANTTNFCTKCGAKKPDEIVCPSCGARYPSDTDAAFCGDCGAKLQQTAPFSKKYEGDGFATPEEALTCYMEGLKNLDFEQMLSAFAWETQMEHFDFRKYFERIRAYQSVMLPRMPSINDFMFSANVNVLRYNQANAIYRSLEQYILADVPEIAEGMIISFRKDTDDVDVFLRKFENGRLEKLSGMTNVRFLSPDLVTGNRFSSEPNQKSFVQQTAYYGADEAVNLVGAADLGDETLFCCPTICRYGDRWYLVSVSSMVSAFLGIDVYHQAFIVHAGSLESLLQ